MSRIAINDLESKEMEICTLEGLGSEIWGGCDCRSTITITATDDKGEEIKIVIKL